MSWLKGIAEAGIRPVWTLIALSIGVSVVVFSVAALGGSTLQVVTTAALINLVLVVGLYIFVGNSGIFSFGQMGFMGIGAYASAIVSLPVAVKGAMLPDLPGFLSTLELGTTSSILVGGAAAAFVALIFGIPFMRLSGIEAGIATLAFLLIVQVVVANWDDVTGGTRSLVGVPIDVTLMTALAWAIGAMALAFAYQSSRFGLRLRSSREDEVAAKSNGISVVRERILAFVLSAFVCGVGGGLLAHFLGALRPDIDFFMTPTFIVTVMLVLGGLRSLTGAVVGVAVVSVITEVTRRLEEGMSLGGLDISTGPGLGGIVLGAVLVAILARMPHGITGSREIGWPFRRQSEGQSGPDGKDPKSMSSRSGAEQDAS